MPASSERQASEGLTYELIRSLGRGEFGIRSKNPSVCNTSQGIVSDLQSFYQPTRLTQEHFFSTVAEAVAHPAVECASEVLVQILLKFPTKVFRQVFALHFAQQTVEQCPFHLNLHLLCVGLHHCNPDQ